MKLNVIPTVFKLDIWSLYCLQLVQDFQKIAVTNYISQI